jgi:CsoR family transcriptional regulator, copper-sensing transcriptional repressor
MAQARGYTATKEQLRDRLARIEGQVRGVARMVEEDRYCIDVLTQISAIQAALDRVGLGLLDDHARHCLVAANGLYLVLLLLGGMVIPVGELPAALRAVARALPAAALSDVVHAASTAAAVPGRAWVVLAAWAVAAPLAAAATFRWE